MSIKSQTNTILQVPSRLQDVVSSYICNLIVGGTCTLTQASTLSGLNISQFSRLLSNHKDLAQENLNRMIRRRLKRVLKKRRTLVPHAPWRVAIIIDSTLHNDLHVILIIAKGLIMAMVGLLVTNGPTLYSSLIMMLFLYLLFHFIQRSTAGNMG